MFEITNLTHSHAGADGKVRKENVFVEGRRLTPGATASFPSLPSSALALARFLTHADGTVEQMNPHGKIFIKEISAISGDPIVSKSAPKEVPIADQTAAEPLLSGEEVKNEPQATDQAPPPEGAEEVGAAASVGDEQSQESPAPEAPETSSGMTPEGSSEESAPQPSRRGRRPRTATSE